MNITKEDIVSSSNIDSGDLIVKILLRLPSNSVHRFRRVCKQWYTLISDLNFIRTHAITHHQLQVSISKLGPFKRHVDFVEVPACYNVQYEDEEDHRKPDPLFVLLELFPTNRVRNYQYVDSSNGLLLFFDNNAICDHQNLNGIANYYVTNPSTKCCFKLPTMIPIPNIKPEEKIVFKFLDSPRHTTLVFDPSISLSYKVIRYLIRRNDLDKDNNLQIYVYSSETETRSWRVLSASIPDPTGTFRSGLRSVVLNGVLYWSYESCWIAKGDDLVCFDVEKEYVWFLPLPPRPEPDYVRNCLYFGECGGRLRLIERFVREYNDRNCLPCNFDVMETEPSQQQQQQQNGPNYTWTVKYRVNIGTVCHRSPFVIHCYKTKNRRGESEDEMLWLKLRNDRTIFSFSLTSNKFKNDEKITIPKSIYLCRDFEDIFAYKPTLFPVS